MSFAPVKLTLVLAFGVFVAHAPAQQMSLAPEPGVLLLRNGELVRGDVLLSGDQYDVSVAGGQLHIKRDKVSFAGRTVLDCYERRKAEVEPGKVQDALDLTVWCLRYRLHEQAALALADAIEADHRHPGIARLERRLKFEMEKPAATATTPAAASNGPSIADLDRTIEGLPPGTVEGFTNSIQPVLLNHCSTAGCHGPQGNAALRLMRMPQAGGKTNSRRATQRNLYSVLALIDEEHPEQSPLLTVPLRPHGTTRAAIFTNRETSQYKQLVAWVYQVANQPIPTGGPVVAEDAVAETRRAARHKPPRRKPTADADGQAAAGARPANAAGEPGQVELTGGIDPFDPDLFNRKYHPPADED